MKWYYHLKRGLDLELFKYVFTQPRILLRVWVSELISRDIRILRSRVATS